MTKQVLGVCGIPPERNGRNELLVGWKSALRTGLDLAVADSELRLPDYRFEILCSDDVLREDEQRWDPPAPGGRAELDPPGGGGHEETELDPDELVFLSAAAEQTTSGRPGAAGEPDVPALSPALHPVAQALGRHFGPGPAVRWISVLRQVYAYQADDRWASLAREQIAARIGPDCQIVIAHSLGSVLAWEALTWRPEATVDTFLTLGSPLAMKAVVDRLRTPQGAADGRLPHVRRWVNIFDPADPVGGRGRLDPLWPAVQDYGVDNGDHAHAAINYLAKRITGRTVAEAFFATGS